MLSLRTARGRSLPLGASAIPDGINFVLLCRNGTSVRLVVYALDRPDVLAELRLDPRKHRTGDHWHIAVSGLPASFRYGWRVDGPTGDGNFFDPDIVLLDPAATSISDGAVWGCQPDDMPERLGARQGESRRQGDKETGRQGGKEIARRGVKGHALVGREKAFVGVAADPGGASGQLPTKRGTVRRSLFFRRRYHWGDDLPPLVPLEDSIIYELHVRGFTVHPSSGVSKPGTFAGLIEKIPYLKRLGITAVELLPVHEFDEDDCPFSNPQTGDQLLNFWGYNSIAFSAPKAAYAWSAKEHGQVIEFRDMVRAMHAAGIEVFLDVVFNHTGEGNERGRTYSFRGLDNQVYYLLGPDGHYLNFSGCGNTVNCNHPIVRDLILTCLRFWVSEMHVDGLRFDLASILGRDRNGNVLIEPPVVEMIAEDGVLRDTKLIAEPWDAGGLYQVGLFPFGRRWSEWNGRYRDEVRRYWRGDTGFAGHFATRITGSSDLYGTPDRRPVHSINFVTCHDGFTLADLVSHNKKHNDANGEGNRDGSNDNLSWNCGVEGPTSDQAIVRLRRRQAKNLLATLLLSQGVPMLLAGDEFLRTQKGNNNAWCQDNEVSWVDWNLAETNADMLRFTQMLIALRKRHPALRRRDFFKPAPKGKQGRPDIVWHGVEPNKPDFTALSRTVALCLDGKQTGREPDRDFYVACNAWREPLAFTIPQAPNGRPWRRAIDTGLPTPLDIAELDEGPSVPARTVYWLEAHSMVVMVSEE
jgi:glycogen operon protein